MDDSLRTKFARDLNCLADDDRFKRRRALTTFQSAVATLNAAFAASELAPAALKCYSDAVEKNRELAVTLVTSLLSQFPDTMPALARPVIAAIGSRVGVFPFAEPTEEIRLLLVQQALVLLRSPGCADAVRDSISVVFEILIRSCGDAFHDVKVSGAGVGR